MSTFANVVWGARCGKSARRVLLGETRSRGYAYSVRRRRESVPWREAPHRLPSSRLVSTILHDVWVQAWRKRHASGDTLIVRYADDSVAGFQYHSEAVKFLKDLTERLAKFGLRLHPEKTRLIEFGRFAIKRRAERGLGKPETFNFLGFTHICMTMRDGWKFQLRRKTQRKRRWSLLHRIGQELDRRRHEPVNVQGQWLKSVLRGHYSYYSVPTNIETVRNVRHHIKVRWYLSLARRSQRTRLSWKRMNVVADRYLPFPTVLHPWPEQRFLVKHPR